MDLSIGKGIHQKAADEKVTGQAEYTDDMSGAQMLHIKLKISPYAHTNIKHFDPSKAVE